MKHKKLIIAMTSIIFAVIVVLCLKELFSVKDITVSYAVSKSEKIESISEKILNDYMGKNIFFVDTDEIKQRITEEKYLKVESVEKKYPNEIVINLAERFERYYYITEDDGVYYFDDEYFIVRKSEEVCDAENLIELRFVTSDKEKIGLEKPCKLLDTFKIPSIAEYEGIDFNSEATKCFSAMSERENITRATFNFYIEQYHIILEMKEGVIIEIDDAAKRIEEKAAKANDFYRDELDEVRKIGGEIKVFEDVNGEIKVTHTFEN